MLRHSFYLISLGIAALTACSCDPVIEQQTAAPIVEQAGRPAVWATPIQSENLGNFYKVSDDLYRAKQPSREGMRELAERGIKTVLDLRSGTKDDRYAKGTGLVTLHYPVPYVNITDAPLIEALRMIRDAEKPVLVHCRHGADRTGMIVALYRIVDQGWTREDAVREMVDGDYGHHKRIYPGIAKYLLSVDTQRFIDALR